MTLTRIRNFFPKAMYLRELFIAFIPETPIILRKPANPGFQRIENPPGPPIELVGQFSIEQLPDPFINGDESTMVQAGLFTGAIVSQSCDIDNKDFLSVAIVKPIDKIGGKNKQDSIREGKTVGAFLLPPTASFSESFIDLSMIFSMHRSIPVPALPKRILSMTNDYRGVLRWRLSNFFAGQRMNNQGWRKQSSTLLTFDMPASPYISEYSLFHFLR